MNEDIKRALLRAHNEKHGIVPRKYLVHREDTLSPEAQGYLDRVGGLKHEAIKLLEKERLAWRKSTMLTTGGGDMFFMMAGGDEDALVRRELENLWCMCLDTEGCAECSSYAADCNYHDLTLEELQKRNGWT
tara:strand:+ start:932 stop:1327 length:396 start_codon:yes stop_codon:yes gene_type:complete